MDKRTPITALSTFAVQGNTEARGDKKYRPARVKKGTYRLARRVELVLATCFYYSGLVQLFQWWVKRSGQRLTILNYHRATGGNLRSHLLYLRRHYRILHMEAALEELSLPHKDGVQRRDQRPLLTITFDDGYRDNYSQGFALARKLQVPFTIFLIPGYTESGEYFWWGEGERLVHRAQVGEITIEGRAYCLARPEDREGLAKIIDAHLRYAGSVKERCAFLTHMYQALAVPASVTPEEEAELPLTWSQVHEMAASGWISFGAHTMHHPLLSCVNDPAEVQFEVGECRRVLEQQLGYPIRTFAYPIGQTDYIGAYGVHAVQKAGYAWAVTTIDGFNTPQTPPHLLRRVSVDVDQHWLVIAVKASGLWSFFTQSYRGLVNFMHQPTWK